MKKGTRQRFFRKSLLQHLLTMLVPVFLFSAVVIAIVSHYITQEANQRNDVTLQQIQQHIEQVLNELDVLVLGFDTEGEMSAQFRNVVRTEELDFERTNLLRLIRSFISSTANARPYIDSIYVYLENENDWVLTSSTGLEKVSLQIDREWYASFLENRQERQQWTEMRPLPRFAFQRENPPETVTLFRTFRNGNGVIVMNTDLLYMQRQLASLCVYEDQVLLIENDRGERMYTSHPERAEALPAMLSGTVEDAAQHAFSYDGKHVAISQSVKYDLRFISVIPEHTLYALSRNLMSVSIVALAIAVLLGVLLAYAYSRSTYQKLQKIYQTFDAATNNQPLPQLPERVGDEYSYITQNLLKTFIQQNYLTVQLEQKHYRLMTMELLALQSQINPHFLVNTLRTIFWKALALTDGAMNGVSEMLENLTSLLDFSLGNPHETVTLAQELEATRCYLEIQQIRQKSPFSVQYDVPDDLLAASTLKLLLQPLVENAIMHGFSQGRQPGAIQVRAWREEDRLHLCVSDDGQGMSEDTLEALRSSLAREESASQFQHIGLYNTSKRIQLFYGQAQGLHIESQPQTGTSVSFSIPFSTVTMAGELLHTPKGASEQQVSCAIQQ